MSERLSKDSDKSPKVSVIMTVYNADKRLDKSIKSILNQTYENFEFIIIDDGSIDQSASIINSYKDPRIVFKSQKNKGQTSSLNDAIKLARGKYIARQDADDYSHKDRLSKQIDFLERNPKVGLVGANYRVVYENGDEWFTTNLFTNPSDLKLAIIFSNQFGHGTVVIRMDVLDKVGYYDESFKIAQDYDLWSRISRVGEAANLKDSLYDWLFDKNSLSTSNAVLTQEEVFRVRDREFKQYLKNKHQYKSLVIHPFSVRLGPKKYFEMKSGLYRNIFLMYMYRNRYLAALRSLIVAFIYAPWKRDTYRFLWIFLFKKSQTSSLKYEIYIQ